MANNLEREQARHILLSKFQETEEKAEREGWLDADEMKLMLKKRLDIIVWRIEHLPITERLDHIRNMNGIRRLVESSGSWRIYLNGET